MHCRTRISIENECTFTGRGPTSHLGHHSVCFRRFLLGKEREEKYCRNSGKPFRARLWFLLCHNCTVLHSCINESRLCSLLSDGLGRVAISSFISSNSDCDRS